MQKSSDFGLDRPVSRPYNTGMKHLRSLILGFVLFAIGLGLGPNGGNYEGWYCPSAIIAGLGVALVIIWLFGLDAD